MRPGRDPLQREVLAALGYADWAVIDPALPDDPLLHALLRAAGRDATSADAAGLARTWPALAELRRDPAAKRALWPQLRRLRRATAVMPK